LRWAGIGHRRDRPTPRPTGVVGFACGRVCECIAVAVARSRPAPRPLADMPDGSGEAHGRGGHGVRLYGSVSAPMGGAHLADCRALAQSLSAGGRFPTRPCSCHGVTWRLGTEHATEPDRRRAATRQCTNILDNYLLHPLYTCIEQRPKKNPTQQAPESTDRTPKMRLMPGRMSRPRKKNKNGGDCFRHRHAAMPLWSYRLHDKSSA